MKIVVAVDLSPTSEQVIAQGKSLAQAYAAELWLLHIAPPDPDFVGYDVGPQTVRDALATQYHEQHAQLQKYAQQMRQQGLEATGLLIQGATAETILKEAQRLEAGLIVIGSHGKGMARQLLLGSTSSDVLKHSEVPVVVVPTRERS